MEVLDLPLRLGLCFLGARVDWWESWCLGLPHELAPDPRLESSLPVFQFFDHDQWSSKYWPINHYLLTLAPWWISHFTNHQPVQQGGAPKRYVCWFMASSFTMVITTMNPNVKLHPSETVIISQLNAIQRGPPGFSIVFLFSIVSTSPNHQPPYIRPYFVVPPISRFLSHGHW